MLALHENERVLGAHRKSWVVFAATVFMSILLTFAPFLIFWAAFRFSQTFQIAVSGDLLMLLTTLWWWLIWLGAFFAFVNYYLDVFIITNERIINIEQIRPFSRKISELRLERVQDVTIEQRGILATFLHFGDIRVQTAGEIEGFVFSTIPRPLQVKEVIMEAQRAAVSRREKTAA